jgi:hypothetical protein
MLGSLLRLIWWYMKWLFVPSIMIFFLRQYPATESDTLSGLYVCMTLIIFVGWFLLVAGLSGGKRAWIRGHWRRIG